MIPFLWEVFKRQVKGDCWFCISSKKNNRWRDHYFKWPDRAKLRSIMERNKDSNLYFCPTPLRKPDRRKGSVIGSSLIWADLDEAKPQDCDLKPSVAWETSPGRYSALWFLDHWASPQEAEQLSKHAAYANGADHSGWDLTQVLRIPGTINFKYEDKPRAKLLWLINREYDLRPVGDDILDKYRRKLPQRLWHQLYSTKPTIGKRSEVLFKLEHEMLKFGIPKKDVIRLIQLSPWNKFKGRRDELDRIRIEVDKASESIVEVPDLKIISMADVPREEVNWLWYPYLARGTLTLLEGDPGLGKSYFLQMVGKSLVDGDPMPGGERLKPGRVLYFGVEDDPSTVVKGRLEDNKCRNLGDYFMYPGPLTLDDVGLDLAFKACDEVHPDLVAFDPVTFYIGGIDMHRANETTQMMERFSRLAKEFNTAVVALRHLTKGGKDKALYRGIGSISFVGTARETLTIGINPDDEEERIVAVTKLNLDRKPKSLSYTIEQGLRRGASKFMWGELSDLTADQILAAPTGKESQRARDWLNEQLKNGDQPADNLRAEAEAAGIPDKLLQRVAKGMVDSYKKKFGGRSYWRLRDQGGAVAP